MSAVLYLIPNLLTDEKVNKVIPEYNFTLIKSLKYFIVESRKPAHTLLKLAGIKTPFEGLTFYELNEHTKDSELGEMIKPLLEGKSMGIISDAGYPAIADPGEKIIELAHLYQIKVIPLAGSSSVFLALATSGLNAEQFTFHGYLPVEKNQRIKFLQAIEKEAIKTGYSQIFMETPYRTDSLLEDALRTLNSSTFLCIASEILSSNEIIVTKSVADWRKNKPILKNKRVVFVLNQIQA